MGRKVEGQGGRSGDVQLRMFEEIPMRYKVFDVEILKTVESVGGWDATDKMGICCAVVYDSSGNTFRVYGDGDEARLITDLLDCDVCVGFNHIEFDWRVVQRLPKSVDPRATMPLVQVQQYDVMIETKKAANVHKYVKGYGLNAIAEVTLGKKKTLEGSLAPVAWAKGEYCKVISYCINDVVLTRDLFELVLAGQPLIDPVNHLKLYLPEPQERPIQTPLADQRQDGTERQG
jgi:DEAD/DEAH box helicase domain-containing protein